MAERRTRASAAADSSELSQTLAAMRKQFGDASIQNGRDQHQPNRISTGSFLLDLALLGGLPENRVNMYYGERSSGKTTMANKAIVSVQAMHEDKVPVVIDVEGTYDADWAAKLGVDLDRLHIAKPETGEQAVDMADAFSRTKDVSLIVVDSIAALTPFKEIDDSAEDQQVGLQARLVGKMVRKLTSAMIAERNRGHEVTILMLNQFRMKIGVMWGDPRSLPGGKALEFSTSVQVEFKNKEGLGKDDNDIDSVIENEHVFKVTKNKCNGGLRSGEFRLRRVYDDKTGLNEGDIDDASTMLSFAKKFGFYVGGGSNWVLTLGEDAHKFRGMDDAVKTLYEDPDLYWALRNQLIRAQAVSLNMPEEFITRYE